ncbi:hypothetical protein Acr_00g0000460 [Actinidia rufa]|uniref:Uncharacterized protein n=1 Tax=Actinidia rufa TaxID=165716 RepID=A0A7J0D6B5_9ERIC|nr:hypothetical protein Acr_00g0000460 [Actinidia rufa]
MTWGRCRLLSGASSESSCDTERTDKDALPEERKVVRSIPKPNGDDRQLKELLDLHTRTNKAGVKQVSLASAKNLHFEIPGRKGGCVALVEHNHVKSLKLRSLPPSGRRCPY